MPGYSVDCNAKGRIFVICPVRPPKMGFFKKVFQKILNLFGAADPWTKTQNAIRAYVEKLEADGHDVYWPPRNNPGQKTDKIGISICKYNRKKMFWADEIHIWYDKSSAGSLFDAGMFFAFVHVGEFKKFVVINRDDVMPTPGKSFENVILALEKEYDNPVGNGLKEKWAKYGK